jgi:hypothetical protein
MTHGQERRVCKEYHAELVTRLQDKILPKVLIEYV